VAGMRIDDWALFYMGCKELLGRKMWSGASAVDLPSVRTSGRSFRFASEAVRVPHSENDRLRKDVPGSTNICWYLLPTARVILR
jgi:hypothetical protein